MTLGILTVDNSVRYFPQSEKTKERIIKPNTLKAGSLPRKKNKNQNNFSKTIAAGRFGILKP